MILRAIYGPSAFTADPAYTAVAALTNILGTVIGGAIQILLLSDSARPLTVSLPDPEGLSMRIITREMGEKEDGGAASPRMSEKTK
jgi:hypothetical protein